MNEAYAHLLEQGLNGTAEALLILVNEASVIERASYLKAAPFERTVARVDHANGYKNKTMLTRLGAITFAVPQVRGSGYVTRSDEREPVARTIRAVFTAGDVNEANEKLKIAVRHWQSVHPMLATWAEENLSEGFAVFGLPEPTGRACAPPMAWSDSTKRSNGAPGWPPCSPTPRAACD